MTELEPITVEAERSNGMDIGSALVSAGGGMLGSAISGIFNAHQADKARDFARHQSQTQYQRAVKDLRKAGLNPILAAMSGGNAALSGTTSAPIQVHTSGALALKRELAEIERLRTESNLNNEQADLVQANRDIADAHAVTARNEAEISTDLQQGRRDRADWYNSENRQFWDRVGDIVNSVSPLVPKTSLHGKSK